MIFLLRSFPAVFPEAQPPMYGDWASERERGQAIQKEKGQEVAHGNLYCYELAPSLFLCLE